MKQFIKASLMLALVLACSTRVFAQDETLEKPTKPQKQTTTTTTKSNKTSTTTTTKSNKTNSNSQTNTDFQTSSSTKLSDPMGYINGYGYVDLGLSVKWATCNVGASSPSDYGSHYAWGETSTKSEYTKENSKTYGKSMGSIAANPQYDVARANWGGTYWRLPTREETEELVDKCNWIWATQGGHNGYMVTGPNGNSIFLPTAGERDGISLDYEGEDGCYWSSTPYGIDTEDAYGLHFYCGSFSWVTRDRQLGCSVRPVLEERAQDETMENSSSNSQTSSCSQSESSTNLSELTGFIKGHKYVDLGLSVKWATCNLGAMNTYYYGNYYAWGETSMKSEFSTSNSKTYGKSMGSIAGNSQYDAARANWGSTWRLPTANEIDELINKCTWTWTSQGGHNGCKVKGLNGNSIFLPAASLRYGPSLGYAGEFGLYWSATPGEDDTDDACDLTFYSGDHNRYWGLRYYGRSVRPVSE